MVDISQIRAARALLDWSGATLAAKSGVSMGTIYRLEWGGNPHPETETAVVQTLEAHGVEFIERGVRFREIVIREAAE